MTSIVIGPRPQIDVLKDKLKAIEEGKLSLWIFIYPLHGIKLKRWVIDKFEEEIQYDIGFIAPHGLTSEDMRFIASRLISRADFMDNLPSLIELEERKER